jgi:hypothetical protein
MKLKRLLSPYTLVLEGSQLSIYGFMAFDLLGQALATSFKTFSNFAFRYINTFNV